MEQTIADIENDLDNDAQACDDFVFVNASEFE